MLLPSEPIKQGVCGELFVSAEYNEAEKEYRQAYRELELDIKMNFHDKANFNCSKIHFAKSVSLLRKLYSQGKVVCIDELPNPQTIKDFNDSQLIYLAETLNDLYFPETA